MLIYIETILLNWHGSEMEMEMLWINKDRSQKWKWNWKMEDANERWNNGNEKRDEMKNLQAMLRLHSKSLYGLVSEIMQKFERKILFIDDDALWIDDENAIWNIIIEFWGDTVICTQDEIFYTGYT